MTYERRDTHARLFATPLGIHEASALVYQRRDDQWVVVQDEHKPIL